MIGAKVLTNSGLATIKFIREKTYVVELEKNSHVGTMKRTSVIILKKTTIIPGQELIIDDRYYVSCELADTSINKHLKVKNLQNGILDTVPMIQVTPINFKILTNPNEDIMIDDLVIGRFGIGSVSKITNSDHTTLLKVNCNWENDRLLKSRIRTIERVNRIEYME